MATNVVGWAELVAGLVIYPGTPVILIYGSQDLYPEVSIYSQSIQTATKI